MPEYISYQQFGQRFFDLAVTEERILGGVNTLAGKPIDVGPIGVGPGRIAKVTAKGSIGQARATPVPGDEISYRVVLPVSLVFDVHLQVDTHRFRADLEVPLTLVARAALPLQVVVDVVAPLPNQVRIDLKAEGLRASMLNRVVGVEDELRRFVAKYVAREVQKESIRKARTIDVASAIDGAYASVAPSGGASTEVAADLPQAFAAEMEERGESFGSF
jgi:hypothetical protein